MFEWLKKLFKRNKEDEGEDFEWDLESYDDIHPDRSKLRLNDPEDMEKYVRSCCMRMQEATAEIDKAGLEFSEVTSRLRDMEEIEALPADVMEQVRQSASLLVDSGRSRQEFLHRKSLMSEEDFRRLERHEKDFPQAIDEMVKNEEYKTLVKRDLKNLEGEKMSYRFRRSELFENERTQKGLVVVVMVTVIIAVVVLLILQYKMKMKVNIGFLICVAAGAISMTAIYVRYNETYAERRQVEKKLNQAILVQNKVKIRYVNVTNLIDYQYTKYGVNSSNELRLLWDRYQKEKEERERFRQIDAAMGEAGERLVSLLSESRVRKPEIWLGQAVALVDPREMVEIRHELVARRGSLRKRIAFNEENRQELWEEVKELALTYKSMAPLIMEIVDEYE